MTDKVAAIQMCSGPDVPANLREAGRWLEAAAKAGARLVVLPENFGFLGSTDRERLAAAEPAGDGPIQHFLAAQARALGVWIVGGTVPIATAGGTRLRAASLLYDDQGRAVARYDKMHLFDVSLPERGEHYRESAATEPGIAPCVAATPCGVLGLSVCYDVRFPELFRRLLADGMELLSLPSAFTVSTGRAHWEVLIRARAIENLCPVIAAAQEGRHPHGRETYGDTMIVSAWGEVLERLPHGAGIVVSDLEQMRASAARERFPALAHRRSELA
jgi:deaminated glutathione amidase